MTAPRQKLFIKLPINVPQKKFSSIERAKIKNIFEGYPRLYKYYIVKDEVVLDYSDEEILSFLYMVSKYRHLLRDKHFFFDLQYVDEYLKICHELADDLHSWRISHNKKYYTDLFLE